MDIVRFAGGLGNQMFQYALMTALRSRGRDVKGCLRFYDIHPETMRFELSKVFKNVWFDNISNEEFEEIDKEWIKIKSDESRLKEFLKDYEKRFFWVQLPDGYTYEPEIFLTKECTFVGCWESEKYFIDCEQKVREAFEFIPEDISLIRLADEISENNFVSIHVRRGDYLNYPEWYGECCSLDYYSKAISYIHERYKGIKFIVFSDDLEWTKNNIQIDNAIYCSSDLFEHYENWYDMFLMGKCKHNIIANSSFSWWGAWLNTYEEKTVVCPKQWIRTRETPEIFPGKWIQL